MILPSFPALSPDDQTRALALLMRILDRRNRQRGGWAIPPSVTASDLAWLSTQGLDPSASESVSHDEAIALLRASRERGSVAQGARAFVASLDEPHPHGCLLEATQLAHAMPEHRHTGSRVCRECGLAGTLTLSPAECFLDWHSSGSGIPGDVRWALLALDQLPRWHQREPSPQATARLHHVLQRLGSQAPTTRARAAARSLEGDLLPSGHGLSVVETLGFAGVLDAPPHVGMATRYLPFRAREPRPSLRVEQDAPTGFWTGANGVNWTNAHALFGLREDAPLPALPPLVTPTTATRPASPRAASVLRRRPAEAGDLWALPVREGTWVLVYVWKIEPGPRPSALAEFVRPLVSLAPPTRVPADLVTQPRYDGRWQHWTSGLEKTTGSRLVGERVPPPAVKDESGPPSRIPRGSGKDLLHLCRSCYPELRDF